jgi:hypothetical protein
MRLTSDGTWIPDDGRPGVAFSGIGHARRSDGSVFDFQASWFADCRCGFRGCPKTLATEFTAKRYGASTGRNLVML